jgi:Popeye protein conserved region
MSASAVIHIANVLYLLSYSVKDILWLRCLTVVAALCLLPYYYVQPVPLIAAIAWNVLFIGINLVQIVILLRERRPVTLTGDQQRLYQLAFRSVTPREFLKLLEVARWEEATHGQIIVHKGEDIDRMMVIHSGAASIRCDERTVAELRPGQFVGEMSFITGDKTSADVVALETLRYVSWSKDSLRCLLKDRPQLKVALQYAIGVDLVGKLKAS